MDTFEYKYVANAFSPSKVLREIEAHEKLGWSLYLIQPTQFLIFGSGGSASLQAVMRRPLAPEGGRSL